MNKLSAFLSTIKFSHTLFALPFAYTGLVIAGNASGRTWFWVTVAMVGLRTTGMITNRLVDFDFDKRNPRTKDWPLAQGLVSPHLLLWVSLPSFFVYFWAARELNPLCFLLSPIPFLAVILYPFLKRFTWLCHVFLGGILAMAPMAGWIAARGELVLQPVPLVFSVLFWVSGFDILYALQDEEFDRREGLFSVPQSFGALKAKILARTFHVLALVSLAGFGVLNHLGIYFWAGFALAAVVIFAARNIFVNAAFSVIIFISTWIDIIL